MSVHLRSITGKVDYEVEQVIRDLVVAANRQEAETLVITEEFRPQITQLAVTVGSLGDLARVSKVQGDSITNLGDQITNIISTGVTVSGIPVDNQVAVWVSASAIEGDAALTWDGAVLQVETADAATNTIVHNVRLSHVTSAVVTDNFGAGLEFELENTINVNDVAGSIDVLWRNAIDEDADMSFKLMSEGVVANEFFKIVSDGTVMIGSDGSTRSTISRDSITFINPLTTIVAGTIFGTIDFAHSDATEAGTAASIRAVGAGTLGEGSLQFLTGKPSSDPALNPRVTIDEIGDVGIGTTAPGFRLDVQRAGNARFINAEATLVGTGYVYGACVNDSGQTYFGVESSVGGGVITGTLANSAFFAANTNTALHLGTNGSVKVTVEPGGDVGIATATPSDRLHVAGASATFGLGADNNPKTITFRSAAAAARATIRADVNNVGDLQLQTEGGQALNLQPSSGNVGIAAGIPLGKLHVDQASAAGATPVLVLDQADVSEEMIEFISTIGVGNAIEAVGAKTLTATHFIKVTLPGGLTRYFQVGTIA